METAAMKKILGVSLTELVVTVAIVSVIGAGAFVGIQQLNEAQNQVQSRAAQMANAQLLLPLIEMEQARHGQQVINADPICLIHHDGTAWKHSCVEGDEVSTPAQGFLTCRVLESGKAQRTAMYFSSALDPESDPEKTAYRLFRQTFESDDCDLSKPDLQTEGFYNDTANFDLDKHDILTGVDSRFILSDEVKSFEVNFSADGLTVENSISFIAGKTLVTEGNTTRIEDNQLDFDSSVTPSLTEDDRPVFSFGTAKVVIASGNDANVHVFSNRPVFEDTTVLWALGNSSSTGIIYAGQTRTSAPIKINNASASDNLILLPSDDYLTDEFAELVIQEKENFKPDVRARLSANRLIYGGPAETIEVFLTGQASGTTEIELEIDQASCDDPDAAPVVLEYSSSDTCLITVEISDGATTPSSEIRIKAAASGTDKLITAAFQAASGSNYYGLSGTPELSFDLVSDLPEISFLSSTSKSIRAASGTKKHRVILLSDQTLSRDIMVKLSVASGATADCSDDYQVENQTDCDGNYETTFRAGKFEHEFEINIKPDSENENTEYFKLAIDEGSYAVNPDNDEHTVNLLQYSVVTFASATIANVDESQATLIIPLTLSPKAENEVKLYFSSAAADATSNQFIDWTFASSSNPLIASGSTATLVLNLEDDSVPEGIEKIAITFDEDKLIGEVIAASDSKSVLTTKNDKTTDQCYPAGDLTIGNTTAKHFHDTEGTDEVSNALIKGGSVQITTGFNSDKDRLRINGASASITTNLETYSNFNFDPEGSDEYTLDITYTPSSGVMKILVDGTGTISANHLVEFFNEYVELTLLDGDYSDTTTRDVVFTLGDAQAWDLHEDGTTHYYRYVKDDGGDETKGNGVDNDGINWIKAFKAASAAEYFGADGYLATITSRAENNFLAQSFLSSGEAVSGWLGGSNRSTAPSKLSDYDWPEGLGGGTDPTTDYVWGWVDGPEKGQLFWAGTAGCGDPVSASSGEPVDIYPYNHSGSITSASGASEQHLIDKHSKCVVRYGNPKKKGYTTPDIQPNWKPFQTEWRQKGLDFLSCVNQNTDLNGNSNMTSPKAPRQLYYGYQQKQTSNATESEWNGTLSEIGTNSRVDPSQNIYRFSNFGCTRLANDEFHQPDATKLKKINTDDNNGVDQWEYYLQLTGFKSGGYMWNDLPNDPKLQPSNIPDLKPFSVQGYYIEWGGDNVFANKKLSQTNTVTPYKCQVSHND